MKNFLTPIFVFLFACNAPAPDQSGKAREEILRADREMSALAGKIGFFSALLQYADTDVVRLNDGQLPIIGKKDFSEFVGRRKVLTALSWEPVKGEAARSGEMGYTWGNWKLEREDTTLFGNYFTAWRKQADGSWKFTLDGGNTTPSPQK